MNKKPTEKKKHLKILSAAMAIVLWFAITYTEDPYISLNVNNLPISFTGESLLNARDLLLVNQKELPSAGLKIRGRRSDISSVLGNISATVDISDITASGSYTRRISYDIPNNAVSIIRRKNTSCLLEIESIVEKNIPVLVTQSDKNKEFLIESLPQEKKISISGAKEDIDKITTAVLSVSVADITENTKQNYPLSFTDENGAVVSPQYQLKTSFSQIPVEHICYRRVTLPFALADVENLDDYQVLIKSFSPDKIEVGIPQDAEIPDAIEAEIPQNLQIGQNQKIKASLILPEGFYFPELPDALTITADIEKLVTQSVTLPISIVNKPEKTQVELPISNISVLLKGPASQIAKAKAVVDLSGLEPGIHTVSVQISAENTILVSDANLSVPVEIK